MKYFGGTRFSVVCNEIFYIFRFLDYRKSCSRKGSKYAYGVPSPKYFLGKITDFSKFLRKFCAKNFILGNAVMGSVRLKRNRVVTFPLGKVTLFRVLLPPREARMKFHTCPARLSPRGVSIFPRFARGFVVICHFSPLSARPFTFSFDFSFDFSRFARGFTFFAPLRGAIRAPRGGFGFGAENASLLYDVCHRRAMMRFSRCVTRFFALSAKSIHADRSVSETFGFFL